MSNLPKPISNYVNRFISQYGDLKLAGIDSKNEILPESTLLNFKNLVAVIVIPALLTPGIKARI